MKRVDVCECMSFFSHLDHEQPLLLLSITLQETGLGSLQPTPAVIQAGQRLQRSVAPHDVQLQNGVVVHGAEQSRAALTVQKDKRVRTICHRSSGTCQMEVLYAKVVVINVCILYACKEFKALEFSLYN